MYGEEDEVDDFDPRGKFYDPVVDPNIKKFDFLDSRQGSVSNHYHKYIDSKTMKKRIKINKRKNYDSLTDSEHYDTINELPGFENQQVGNPKQTKMQPSMTYRAPPSEDFYRTLNPSTGGNYNNYERR